jgi:prevent-host-death family protein
MSTAPAREVGAYEAKTHLPALLDRVERGEEIIITRRGRPIARLVPAKTGHDVAAARAALADLLTLRDEIAATSGSFTRDEILSARDEGRKY